MNNCYSLMRHGESLANQQAIIVSRPENARDGYGLTAKGVKQVRDSAFRARLSQDITIVSSDYLRARETAEIVADTLRISKSIELTIHLRERNFGDWELSTDANYSKVWQQDKNYPDQSIDGVESVVETLARGVKAIEAMERKYDSQHLLLVGHGDVLQILFAYYSGIEARLHRSIPSIKNAEFRRLASRIV